MSAIAATKSESLNPQIISVRKATPDDCSQILKMIRALAVYQGVGDRVHSSIEALRRDGFGPTPKFEALIAERQEVPVGLAIFQPHYSSWESATILQITDLFVDEIARGTGVGFRLALEVAKIAKDRGCAGLQLNMVHANPSRASLDRIGFVHQDDLLHYRLDTPALNKFLDTER